MQVYLDNLYALYLTSIEWSVSSLFKTVTGARDWGPAVAIVYLFYGI